MITLGRLDVRRLPILVLSLKTDERLAIFRRNVLKIPGLELVQAIDGYDTQKTIDSFRALGITFHSLAPKFQTYGTLANFVTKVLVLQRQVADRIPYLCFIEDDLVLRDGFVDFVRKQANILTGDVNMVRLGRWGEGYITSFDGATRILDHIRRDGVIDSIDNQLREHCGREVRIEDTPWKLKVPTNAGDCARTPAIDEAMLAYLRSLPRI